MNKDQQKLVEDNLNLVYFIVNKYYPTYIQDEDIIQCGMLGLCKASEQWDETVAFSTYATVCIRNEIRYELRKRKKHNGCLSLDYVYRDADDETVTLGETIIGDENVPYVNFDGFYDALSTRQKRIVDLTQCGLSTSQIGDALRVSNETIKTDIRKIKRKWESINGNKS